MATKQKDPTPGETPVVPPAIYRQMNAAMAAFAKAGLAKRGKNVSQNFSFRGIDDLMDLASPILVEHGILVFPTVVSRVVSERETRNGAILYSVTLDVEFAFVSALDGSRETVRFVGEGADSGDKATSKALSMAFKYAFFQCFVIPISGQMEEADETTPEETVTPKPEGYDIVKMAAKANAVPGTKAVKDYAFSLKSTPQFAAWDYLVKHDKEWADIKAVAEQADKQAAAKIAADVKTQGTRVPGETE